MRLRHLLPLIVAATALCAVPCGADEVQLKNGDRLTGTVVSLDAGTLKFKTAHGDLSIGWPEVTALTIDEPILIRSADGKVTTHSGDAIDIAATTSLTRPVPPLEWDGGANAGFVQTSLTGDDNLFVKMKNGVRLGLVAGLVTTVQLDLDYDRSPAPDRRRTDRTFALTFGYRF